MDLSHLISGHVVHGMPFDEYVYRINNEVVLGGNGMILLQGGTVINCVSDYYDVPNVKSVSNRCYEIHKVVDPSLRANQCIACHNRCIDKHREGELGVKASK